jgi:hypothetical protein
VAVLVVFAATASAAASSVTLVNTVNKLNADGTRTFVGSVCQTGNPNGPYDTQTLFDANTAASAPALLGITVFAQYFDQSTGLGSYDPNPASVMPGSDAYEHTVTVVTSCSSGSSSSNAPPVGPPGNPWNCSGTFQTQPSFVNLTRSDVIGNGPVWLGNNTSPIAVLTSTLPASITGNPRFSNRVGLYTMLCNPAALGLSVRLTGTIADMNGNIVPTDARYVTVVNGVALARPGLLTVAQL